LLIGRKKTAKEMRVFCARPAVAMIGRTLRQLWRAFILWGLRKGYLIRRP